MAGCKILKQMAHLESEAESARSMKEAKYEQFALGEKCRLKANTSFRPNQPINARMAFILLVPFM